MKTQSQIVVKKFGGTSVGSIERIEAVAERVGRDYGSGQRPIVVASAMSGETNKLVQLAADINPYYKGLAYDLLLASGEQVSVALLAIALEKRGFKAVPLLAYQMSMKTDGVFSKAKIQSIDSELLQKYTEQGVIPVIAGFQGITEDQKITTLGRGGTDTTAVAVAAALECDSCEIYTDVPKVYTADPRLVPKAREIGEICFEEMMEMASLGSKILHVRCVELAAKFGVKIHVRSTFEEREGTWIVPQGRNMENPVVSAVTHEKSVAILKLFPVPYGPGFLADLFQELATKGVVVDIITQSYNKEGQRLAFSIEESEVHMAVEVVESLLPDIEMVVLRGMAKLSVVGVGMVNHPGVASRFFRQIDKTGAPLHLVTTSDIKISAVIDTTHLQDCAQAIHSEFGLDREE